jgi:hypothetical protein
VELLFAEAKPAEQGVQKVLDPSPTGNPVDRRPRDSKLLCDQHRIRQGCTALEGRTGGLQQIMLPPVQRELIALGQQFPSSIGEKFEESRDALSGFRRNGEIEIARIMLGKVRLRGQPNNDGMIGRGR